MVPSDGVLLIGGVGGSRSLVGALERKEGGGGGEQEGGRGENEPLLHEASLSEKDTLLSVFYMLLYYDTSREIHDKRRLELHIKDRKKEESFEKRNARLHAVSPIQRSRASTMITATSH